MIPPKYLTLFENGFSRGFYVVKGPYSFLKGFFFETMFGKKTKMDARHELSILPLPFQSLSLNLLQ